MQKAIKKGVLFLGLMIPLFLTSCYYDNYDDLNTGAGSCDTTLITYSANIGPIMTLHCTKCHSGGAPAGNITLDNYTDVKASAMKGSLLGTIEHASGWVAMPKNELKLDDCSINKVRAWINQGVKK